MSDTDLSCLGIGNVLHELKHAALTNASSEIPTSCLQVTEGGSAFGAACLAAAAQNYTDKMGKSPPSRRQPGRRRTTTE